jgi:predicted O-linked N-acetylglucosamine transferase (SPINDLY family)/predicted SAM-dependent methyltransferase
MPGSKCGRPTLLLQPKVIICSIRTNTYRAKIMSFLPVPQTEATMGAASLLQDAAFYEQAIEREPEELSHYWHLGVAYLLKGNEADAQTTWLFALSQGDEQQQQNWLHSLAEFLKTTAESYGQLEQPQTSWLIRRHLRELLPTDFENVLRLVELSFKLDTFDDQDFTNWELSQLIQTHSIDPPLVLQLIQVLTSNALKINIPIIDFVQVALPQVQHIPSWINIYAEAIRKIGFDLHRSDYAIQISQQCLEISPQNITFLSFLARFYLQERNYEQSLMAAEKMKAASTQVGSRQIANALILRTLLMAGRWTDIGDTTALYKEGLDELFVSPQIDFSTGILQALIVHTANLAYLQDNLAENRQYQNQVAKRFTESFCQSIAANSSKIPDVSLDKESLKHRKIKIGYIGSTFRTHSVGWLCRWLFQHHDREQFTIYLYSVTKVSGEPFFETWFRPHVDQFVEVLGHSTSLIHKIQENEIDILIDLDSHTLDYTCQVMAAKPAPIQVTWLGNDASGLPTIDYFLADPHVLPDNAQAHYQEKIWRLPHTYLAVDGFEVGYPTLHREDLDIPTDAIVYFSSQTALKRHPAIMQSQLEIIKKVPNSYFLIKGQGDPDVLKAYFCQACDDLGVNPDRLRFLEYSADEYTHRANMRIADIVLDTYPYSGATTTLEALWSGLPVVTRVGETFSARNSYAFLVNAGVSEGIAWSAKEYVEWGVRLGTDESLREEVTWKLQQSRYTSPLWNAKQFTKEMEAAYEQMYLQHILHKSVDNDLMTSQRSNMVRKLHIGGKVKCDGWEVLNANPAPYVDHVCNANDLSQFPDNTFSAVYASHIVEHLDYQNELKKTLDEWNRVLTPGGQIFISVPDLDTLAWLILEKDELSFQDRFLVMRMMFGGHVDQYDYHVVGLNEEFLTAYLNLSGYVNIKRVEGFGLFDDTSNMVFHGVAISLNIVAEKPQNP